jgi:hypothetical protein
MEDSNKWRIQLTPQKGIAVFIFLRILPVHVCNSYLKEVLFDQAFLQNIGNFQICDN